jgi:ABC-2 type transport system permease protein
LQTLRDTIRFRHVLFALSAKELKAQYRNMALGFLWAALNPLVMITVLTVAFVVFFGAGLDHPCRIVVALIPFNFFTYCLSGCSGAVLGNSALVRKVWFPRQILPLSVILTHLVHFGIQSLLIALVLALFPTPGSPLSWNLLWLPPILVVQVGLVVGLGLLVSALNVVFRDTQYIVESMLTVLFWISPVVYDASATFADSGGGVSWPERCYFLNPVAGILDSYRRVLFHGAPPDAFALTAALVVTLLVGVVAIRVFFRFEREFAELVR